jgi:hypothetical protein
MVRTTHADFATVLRQDPKSTETKKALDEIVVLMSERNENDLSVVDPEQRGPSINDPKTELESVSDSSDWNHEGNGYPCPFYNNDGCARGLECEFSHAPDHTGKSVRDRLCVSASDPLHTPRTADFAQWLAGATLACAFYLVTALVVVCIPMIRLICRLVGGGRVKRRRPRFGK